MIKFIKLVTGENLLVNIDTELSNLNPSFLSINEPVEIRSYVVGKGKTMFEQYTMQPWIRLAKKGIIKILSDSIITIVDVDNEAIKQYKDFCKNYEQQKFELEEDLIEKLEEESYAEELDKFTSRKIIH